MYGRRNRILPLNNYDDYRAKALKGRTYDDGDRGVKIAKNMYLFLHEGSYPNNEEHVRLVFYATDLAHFYPDRIVFMCDGFDTVTTNQRISEFTPFTPYSNYGTKFDKFASGTSAQARLHLQGAPSFGLTRESGVTCSWRGEWIPTPDKAGEYVELTLPRAGARSRARKIANKIRKELRPYLVVLQGARIQLDDYRDDEFVFIKYNVPNNIRTLVEKWVEREPPTEQQRRYLIDCLLFVASGANDVNATLNHYINVEGIWCNDLQTNEVHYTEVDALLEPRGPEWPESMS